MGTGSRIMTVSNLLPREGWPTENDLPYSDGIPMDSQRQVLQMQLLQVALVHAWADREDFFVGANMFLYYSLEQVRNRDFIGPDVFVALNVPRRERKSWVMWQEGKGPDAVIELLSETTAQNDKTVKKAIYQDDVKAPEYFWYDPFDSEDFRGFRLRNGVYEAIEPDQHGRMRSEAVGLLLAPWDGDYQGIRAVWLRWAWPDGTVLPTPAEAAAAAEQLAAAE